MNITNILQSYIQPILESVQEEDSSVLTITAIATAALLGASTYFLVRSQSKCLFQRALQAWCNQQSGTLEYANRVEAADRIINCYNRQETRLDLSRLQLTSLPPQIGQLQQLTILFLDDNRLTSLPAEIGQLQQLTFLDMSGNRLTPLPAEIGELQQLTYLELRSNQLTSLPPQIGQLWRLRYLGCNRNRLTSLPAEIGQLQQLIFLDLSSNRLTSLPPQIEQLRQLTHLDLAYNRLTSLPPQIEQLRQLTHLDLAYNRLTSLPPQIEQLRQLTDLDLAYNRLNSLPNEILNLPGTCTVNLSQCPLSERVLDRIRQATSGPDYQGPRISHSIHDREPAGESKSLNDLLDEFYSYAGKAKVHLDNLSEDESETLRCWMSRLSDTADFKRDQEAKNQLAAHAVAYIELAKANQSFRDEFFQIIEDAASSCGDRVTLSLLHLGIAHRLMTIPEENTCELADFLINTVWAIDQLEKIARHKIEGLPLFDEIEVYLGYMIPLARDLGLELDVSEMLYFRCSNISSEDLREAREAVLKNRTSEQEKYQFLIGQTAWRKALQAKYPGEYPSTDREDWSSVLIDLTRRSLDETERPTNTETT